MSQADLKALRKMDFPACAKEALSRIDVMLAHRGKQNQTMQLVSEFIFMERSKDIDARKGLPHQPAGPSQLNSFQELELIMLIIEFFAQPGPDVTRNAIFLTLFGSNLTPKRSNILCQLISISISCAVPSVLCAAGVWMQQMGHITPPCLEVAQSLVTDFIAFSRKTSDQLRQLPMVAQHFVANLMTALTELYFNEHRGALVPPPDTLLEVLTDWVKETPGICLASLSPSALPPGIVAMPVVTPIAGLVRWTTLAPIISQKATYSKLHLALIRSLLKVNNTGPVPTAVNALHLALIVGPLKAYAANVPQPAEDATYNNCVDRLAEAVQVTLASNCVFGNIQQLIATLETLPAQPFLEIIISKHKTV